MRPVRSASATSVAPCSSVATIRPVAQSSTSRWLGARTTGIANSEPVLARTALGSYGSAAWPVTITPCAPNASADRISVPMLPGVLGRSKTTTSRSGRVGDPVEPVLGQADDGDQLLRRPSRRARAAAPSDSTASSWPRSRLLGPPGPRPAGVQEDADLPAVLDGQRDRPYALDQELAGPLPLGPVGQQRLPLLEGGVAGADLRGTPTHSVGAGRDDQRHVHRGVRRAGPGHVGVAAALPARVEFTRRDRGDVRDPRIRAWCCLSRRPRARGCRPSTRRRCGSRGSRPATSPARSAARSASSRWTAGPSCGRSRRRSGVSPRSTAGWRCGRGWWSRRGRWRRGGWSGWRTAPSGARRSAWSRCSATRSSRGGRRR